MGSHTRVLSWVLHLGSYFGNYFLNFKREIITIFYIINDTLQLLSDWNVNSFKFNLMGPPKSILHMTTRNLSNKNYFILHMSSYDLLANFDLLQSHIHFELSWLNIDPTLCITKCNGLDV